MIKVLFFSVVRLAQQPLHNLCHSMELTADGPHLTSRDRRFRAGRVTATRLTSADAAPSEYVQHRGRAAQSEPVLWVQSEPRAATTADYAAADGRLRPLRAAVRCPLNFVDNPD